MNDNFILHMFVDFYEKIMKVFRILTHFYSLPLGPIQSN